MHLLVEAQVLQTDCQLHVHLSVYTSKRPSNNLGVYLIFSRSKGDSGCPKISTGCLAMFLLLKCRDTIFIFISICSFHNLFPPNTYSSNWPKLDVNSIFNFFRKRKIPNFWFCFPSHGWILVHTACVFNGNFSALCAWILWSFPCSLYEKQHALEFSNVT